MNDFWEQSYFCPDLLMSNFAISGDAIKAE